MLFPGKEEVNETQSLSSRSSQSNGLMEEMHAC